MAVGEQRLVRNAVFLCVLPRMMKNHGVEGFFLRISGGILSLFFFFKEVFNGFCARICQQCRMYEFVYKAAWVHVHVINLKGVATHHAQIEWMMARGNNSNETTFYISRHCHPEGVVFGFTLPLIYMFHSTFDKSHFLYLTLFSLKCTHFADFIFCWSAENGWKIYLSEEERSREG